MITSNKKLGRVIGFLLLLLVVTGSTSLNLRGLSTSLFDSQTFYYEIAANAFNMRLSVLLDIVASFLMIGIAILVYPLMKAYNQRLALWYVAIYVAYLALIFISDIYRLSLINMSIDLTTKEVPGNLQSLGLSLWDSYVQAHFFTLILSSLASGFFYYLLFAQKLVPRFLALWGVIAQVIVFTVTWIQIYGQNVDFGFYIQNGVFILVILTWLLVKGLKDSPAPIQD
jgi:hypothetical protein